MQYQNHFYYHLYYYYLPLIKDPTAQRPTTLSKSTPASVIDQSFYIDAHHQYRFAFVNLLCLPLQDHERTWKFDAKNDIIQHATSVTPTSASVPTRTRTALIPIPPTAALHRTKRDRSQTNFYKPHDIRAVTEALRTIMDRKKNTSHIHTDDNEHTVTDTDIMRSYAIDTLFDSEYFTGDTEEIETADALKAPDSAQFIIAIQKEVHSLITATRTLIPIRGSRLLRKHNKQKNLENTNDTQVQANERRNPTESQTSTRHAPQPAETHSDAR